MSSGDLNFTSDENSFRTLRRNYWYLHWWPLGKCQISLSFWKQWLITNKYNRCQNLLKKALANLKCDIKNWRVFSYWSWKGDFFPTQKQAQKSLLFSHMDRNFTKICKLLCKLKNRKVWAPKILEEMENGFQKHTILALYSHHHFLNGRPRVSIGLTRKKQLSFMNNKLQLFFLLPIPQHCCLWVEAFVDCDYNRSCSINNK